MYSLSLILTALIATTGAATSLNEQVIFPLQEQHVHGSSIVETPTGDLIAVWFQGSGERQSNDVRLRGARLRKDADAWSDPFDMADTPEFPDCNPVLFLDSQQRLWLFWTVVLANRWENSLVKFRRADRYESEGPPEWNWQDVITLRPGDTFAERIATAFKELNPPEDMWSEYAQPYSQLLIEASRDKLKRQLGWMTRNHPLVLSSGRILLPLYSDGFNVCIMACSDDDGATWYPSQPVVGLGPIQPTLAQRTDGSLIAYFRDSGDAPKRVQQAVSTDEGITWSNTSDTSIANPSSSLEVLALSDGRWILICNDLEDGRYRLGVFLSNDEGASWGSPQYLEEDAEAANAYAYPSILQAADGMIHASYSYHTQEGRTIKHVSFSPEWLVAEGQEAPSKPVEVPQPDNAATTETPDIPEIPKTPEPPASEPVETPAEAPSVPDEEAQTDPKSLLESVAASLATQTSFAFDFNAKFTYTRSGSSQEASMEGNVILGKGNQGLIHIQRTNSDVHTYNTEDKRIAYSPGLNSYSPLPVINSRRELIATMTPGTIEPALGWLADMTVGKSASFDSLVSNTVERDGIARWEIQAEREEYKMQLVLSQEQPPKLLALTMDFKEPLINKYKFPANSSLTVNMEFRNWQLDTEIPDSTFVYTPAPDAKQTALEELTSKPKIEVGEPAPDFSLEKLGGGTVTLKNYIGKEVILLEFWRTNCTVCQQVSPLIMDIAKAFADQELSVFAVNLREDEDKIRSFLKEETSAATVLMDKNGQAGALYEVTGVPKMVLIGKDGRIKEIYKGMPSNLGEHLTGRIQDLLQGKEDTPASVAMIVQGAPAPDFSLEELSGEALQLSDHFGDKVIALCFWATHCGFCRKALPIFAETAQKFSDQNVVFYAVNLRETKDKVESYLQEQGLTIPVLLDSTAEVGTLYEVKGIPRIVVIGRDALIKAVNQGLPSNLSELLTSQIQSQLP